MRNMIPNRLIRLIISERVVPFIGAGFSRDYGYPGWMDLLSRVAILIGVEDLDVGDAQKADPLQIAQSLFHFYKEKNNEETKNEIIAELGLNNGGENGEKPILNEILTNIIDIEIGKKLEFKFSEIVLSLIQINEENVEESAIEKLNRLKDLPFNHLLTTNYDHVLEGLFENHQILAPGKGEELSWNESNNAIFKIHGDINSPEGIIFTHAQYYKFMHDFGYFRSKLYTLFSSNVVLMMGYGFNDINIHQIYFQFMRDYGDQVDGDKFYIVLTQYDKDNWGTYFNYYVRFLKTYKINVIETTDLPTFVEEMARQVESERAVTSLASLIEFQNIYGATFTDVLKSTIKNGEAIYHNNQEMNKNLLEAFKKIYKGPYILNEEPFSESIEGTKLSSSIGRNIFNYVKKLVDNDPLLATRVDFFQLVNDSLDFITWTNGFYEVEERLRLFVSLSGYLPNVDRPLNESLGELLYDVFEKCHPTKYLYSNPGGRFLRDNLSEISEFYFNSYLKYMISNIEIGGSVSYMQRYWIRSIKETFIQNDQILAYISQIEEYITNDL